MSETSLISVRKPGLSRKGRILALLLSIGAGLACAELVLRLCWQNTYAGASPNYIYKLRLENANSDYRIDRRKIDVDLPSVRFRTDKRSYLLPSFQHECPDATIAFLGGSTTECMAVQEPLRFHALVSDTFANKNLKVNTLNAARSGNTLHDSLNTLINHVVQDKPNVVVLMNVTNDIGVLMADGDYRSRMSQCMSWKDSVDWLSQVLSSHLFVAGAIRSARNAYVFSSIQPKASEGLRWRNDPTQADKLPIKSFEQRLRSFIHLCRDFDIEPVLMTEPMIFSTSPLSPGWGNLGAQDRFNSLVVAIGREEGAAVIDLVKYLHDCVPDWDKEMEVFYDGMHVTDKGSKVYAQHIAEALEPVIHRIVADRSAAMK